MIQKTRGKKVKEFVLLCLKQHFKNEKVFDFDVPSIIKKVTYGNLSVVSQDYYWDKIVKILDHTKYPNLGHSIKDIPRTPISWAAIYGHTKIVQILVPLKDNPNASNNSGVIPIIIAASWGHTEIVKILVPLTDSTEQSYRNCQNP